MPKNDDTTLTKADEYEGARAPVPVSLDQGTLLDDDPPHDPETGEIE